MEGSPANRRSPPLPLTHPAIFRTFTLRHFPDVAKDISTQLLDALMRAERPLIALPAAADVDTFAGAFGLARMLSSIGKKVIIACEKTVPSAAEFLRSDTEVVTSLQHLRTLAVTLPTGVTLASLQRTEADGKVSIIFTPERGEVTPEQLVVTQGPGVHDLLITIGARDLGSLGKLFAASADILTSLPILNIDWHPANEEFGRWNVVDVHAGSIGETIANLLLEISPENVNGSLATALLAGMIAKTKNFRTDKVTPATLALAANLIERGAERMTVIEHLFRTRSVDAMRLWGTVFARVEEPVPGVFTSTVGRDEFLKTHTTPENLVEIAQEILTSSSLAKIVIFVFEEADAIRALAAVNRPLDARSLFTATKMEGTRDLVLCTFPKEKGLAEAQKELIALAQNGLSQ